MCEGGGINQTSPVVNNELTTPVPLPQQITLSLCDKTHPKLNNYRRY